MQSTVHAAPPQTRLWVQAGPPLVPISPMNPFLLPATPWSTLRHLPRPSEPVCSSIPGCPGRPAWPSSAWTASSECPWCWGAAAAPSASSPAWCRRPPWDRAGAAPAPCPEWCTLSPGETQTGVSSHTSRPVHFYNQTQVNLSQSGSIIVFIK